MPTRTRRLVLAGLALASFAVPPAAASPVEQQRAALVQFDVVGSDGRLQHVQLAAVAGRLTIGVERCEDDACSASVSYEGAVPGTFVVDPGAAEAHLRSTLPGGHGLVVDWVPTPAAGPSVSVGGLDGAGNGTDDSLYVYRGSPAEVHVQLDGSACRTGGLVGDRARVAFPDGSSAGRRALSRLRLVGGTASCSR